MKNLRSCFLLSFFLLNSFAAHAQKTPEAPDFADPYPLWRKQCVDRLVNESLLQSSAFLESLGAEVTKPWNSEVELSKSRFISGNDSGWERMRKTWATTALSRGGSETQIAAEIYLEVGVFGSVREQWVGRVIDELGNIIEPGKLEQVRVPRLSVKAETQIRNLTTGVVIVHELRKVRMPDENVVSSPDPSGAQRRYLQRTSRLDCFQGEPSSTQLELLL